MINRNRLRKIFYIFYLIIIYIHPICLYLGSNIISKFPEASQPNYDFFRTDKYIAYDNSYAVYGYLSSGRLMYGYIESDHTTDYFDFFICDESNYNTWILGGIATRYQYQTHIHTNLFSFSAPYAANWYVVIDNVVSYGIYIDIFIDYDTNNKPNYDIYTYDYVINDRKLEPNEYYALNLGSLSTRDNLQVYFTTFFDSDYLYVYLLSYDNYIAFSQDLYFFPEYSWLSYSSGSAYNIRLSSNDIYYLVFSAKYASDTLRFGAGVIVQYGYYSNWFLDYGLFIGIIALGIVSGVIIVVQVKKRKDRHHERRLEEIKPSQTNKTTPEKVMTIQKETITTPIIKKIDVLPIKSQEHKNPLKEIVKEGWYCAFCGKWNLRDLRFCERCGARLGIQF